MTDRVLAVVQSFRRPHNILAVIEALRAQSVPLHIALVDCADQPQFAVDPDTAGRCDDVFTVKRNIGACCRLIPPAMLPQFRYVFFAVDDHLPGPRHVECLLRTAKTLGDRFSTIGQDGRVIHDGHIVKRRASLAADGPRMVDVVTSSELMETCWAPAVLAFRSRIARVLGAESDSMLSEDDLVIAFGLRRANGTASYLTAACEPDEFWSVKRLPSSNALCSRPDHAERRDQFIAKMKGI